MIVVVCVLVIFDGLFNGCVGVYLVIGFSDVDVCCDGDFVDKDECYWCVVEYLEVFICVLESCEFFDYYGEFYWLEDVGSGFLLI